jgi:hypothetical protein
MRNSSPERAAWKALSDAPRKFRGKVRITSIERVTYGGLVPNLAPCGRCGCAFVNIGCPKMWPIGTVVLTCSMCGRVRDYIDGLLIMSVTEALVNRHGRDWIVRHRMATDLSEQRGVDPAIIELAMAQGMTMDEIATALDIGT